MLHAFAIAVTAAASAVTFAGHMRMCSVFILASGFFKLHWIAAAASSPVQLHVLLCSCFCPLLCCLYILSWAFFRHRTTVLGATLLVLVTFSTFLQSLCDQKYLYSSQSLLNTRGSFLRLHGCVHSRAHCTVGPLESHWHRGTNGVTVQIAWRCFLFAVGMSYLQYVAQRYLSRTQVLVG